MKLFFIFLLFFSSFLNVAWHASLKKNKSVLINFTAMNFMVMIISLPIFIYFYNKEIFNVFFLFSLLFHLTYKYFLVKAYSRIDLISSYPLFKSITPIFVIILSYLFFSQKYSIFEIFIIFIIFCLLINFYKPIFNNLFSLIPLFFLSLSAAFYTIIDSYIINNNFFNIYSFIFSLFFFDALFFCLLLILINENIKFEYYDLINLKSFITAILGILSYILFLLSFKFIDVYLVSIIRETSIIYSFFFSYFYLKEKFLLRNIYAPISLFLLIVVLVNYKNL